MFLKKKENKKNNNNNNKITLNKQTKNTVS